MTPNIIPACEVTTPPQHLHIASIVAHIRPENVFATRQWVLQDRSEIHAEIHADNSQGKMVVVTESDAEKAIVDFLEEFRDQPGVLNVALVYHEYFSPDDLQKESLLEVQS